MKSLQKVTFYLLIAIIQNGWAGVFADDVQTPANPRFKFFLKSNPDTAMTLEEISSVSNPPQNLFVYVHGWKGKNLEDAGSIDFKDYMLKETQDFDVVMLVDWTPNTNPNYLYVKDHDAPIVARKLAEELKRVNDLAHIPPSQTTMTSHSLGTKVIGKAGRQLEVEGYGLIKKMVALDSPSARWAKKGDAGEVIAFHTGKFPLGNKDKLADKDYFFGKSDHPALKDCFSNSCFHKEAKQIGKEYFGGQLNKYLPNALNSDPSKRMKNRLTNYQKEQSLAIFVLDYSGSMQSHGRIENMIASTKSRLGSLHLDREVAMVAFGSSASVLFGPTKVTDESVRQRLIDLVPDRDHNMGGTSIGAGLRAAIGLIPKGTCPAIVLATDGEENEAPLVKDVQSEISKCTSVSAMAVGSDASTILEGLTKLNGGKIVSIADDTGEEKFTDGLKSLEEAQMPPQLRTVDYPAKELKVGEKSGVDFMVDPGLKDIRIKHPSLDKDVEVTVIPPKGDVSACKRGDGVIKCSKGTPGKYKVKASKKKVGARKRKRDASEEEEISVRLSATPDITAATLPALLEAGLSNSTVDPQSDQLTMIFGELKSELHPVLGAAVEAYLTSPEGDKTTIKLYDDGVGADETKGDGIYSRYIFTALVVGQRYEVMVRASCVEEGKCKVQDSNWRERLAELFEREVIAGSIRALSEYKAPPPAAVSDLTVIDYEKEVRLVTLRWTAVGANADSDKVAAGVKIKWTANCNSSCQWEEVKKSLYQEQKLEGTPREFQQVKLSIPKELAGESGENCVHFNVIYHNNQTSAQDSNIISTCDWKPEVGEGIGALTIFLIVVGVLAALGGVGIIGFVKRKKLYSLVRSNNQEGECQDKYAHNNSDL